jgi:flagellar biosynthesis protein FlhA
MAIYSGPGSAPQIEGAPTQEPAFGLPAWWIPSHTTERARSLGFTVVDPVSILGTHLAEITRRFAHELFSRQDTKKLLDRVTEENAKVVEDLVPKLLSMAMVQRVLQNLLRERVSIRDGVSILEALSEGAQITKNPILLTEYVRQSIRRMVIRPYLSGSGELPAFFLDPALEQALESSLEHSEQSSQINVSPQRVRDLVDRIGKVVGKGDAPGVLLTSSPARFFVRQMLESSYRNLHVLAHGEVPPGIKVISLGVVA